MINTTQLSLFMRWRLLKDQIARHAMGIGGMGVIIAIVLIFIYLIYVVLPLFKAASIEKVASYASLSPASGTTLYLAMEEQAEIGLRVSDTGMMQFFHTRDGQTVKQISLPLPPRTQVTSLAEAMPNSGLLALGLSNGQVLVFKHTYRISFPDNQRVIEPFVEYPVGEKPFELDRQKQALYRLAIQADDEAVTLVGITADKRILLSNLTKEESMLEEDISWRRIDNEIPHPQNTVTHLLLDKEQRNLYFASNSGDLSFYDVSDKEAPELVQHLSVVSGGAELSALVFLAGDISLLVGTSDGRVLQWFPVRKEGGKQELTYIREFNDLNSAITSIVSEHNRKGFLAADQSGYISLYHSTAERTLLTQHISDLAIKNTAFAPRADAILVEDQNRIYFYKIHNEHPEISWSSLWEKVWYESYQQPEYVWQSSSASNDFEPKLSLVPLSFGTIKAAFYAMLFAIPLALMGAIFTAHFMAPRMRQMVKPTIEIMEALPTVILGFLAGLWLAPFMEDNLPGIFSLLILLPFGMLVFAYFYHSLSSSIRHAIPEGWEGALLIPVVILIGYLCFMASPFMEDILFGGDMRIWLSEELNMDYDQRNSLIVGIAMGFAVIPTIFSIAEDAIFAVPKHLVHGSLALGATPWQTMVRVVLLTASPGIFSAVMIGLGRAVGETMIVLMATGNTPVMDFSFFQGMRTLSANIAVEMPESEVDSTHYRVVFLAAVVLFAFTFIFNTVAEIVRQRLRQRYSSL